MAKRKKDSEKGTRELIEEAAVLIQLLRRLEEADDNGYVSCVTCGKTKHYRDGIQGGHYVPRGTKKTILVEINVNPQCIYCNKFQSGAYAEYTLWMIDKHGREEVDKLRAKKGQPHTYTKQDVLDIKADFKRRIKVEEARVIG